MGAKEKERVGAMSHGRWDSIVWLNNYVGLTIEQDDVLRLVLSKSVTADR